MTEDGTKNTKKTPVLGIIDAVSMNFIENVPAAPNCKTVVADPKTNRIFMLPHSLLEVGLVSAYLASDRPVVRRA